MRDCLANALSYDARICNAAHHGPFAARLLGEIVAVAAAIAGAELKPMQIAQLFMRREDGGVDVNDPVASGARARVAAVIERGPDLRARLRQLYPSAAPETYCKADGAVRCRRRNAANARSGYCNWTAWAASAGGHYPSACRGCTAATGARIALTRRI